MTRPVLVLLALAACDPAAKGPISHAPVDTDVTDVTDTDTTDVEADEDGDGFVPSAGDCDDHDDTVYPNAPELCDGKDNDCDNHSDADDDLDGDGERDCLDACPIRVDALAAGPGTGTVTDPFPFVQDAIDASTAIGCSIIRVGPGTYDESIDLWDLDLDIASTKGAPTTILRGDGSQSVVTIAGGQSDATILEGFTITEGGGGEGAGIYIDLASPRIVGNTLVDNLTSVDPHQGGGIFLRDSDAQVSANTIRGNDAGYGGIEQGNDGGGLFVRNGAPEIFGNLIVENTAGDGGGLWFARSDALVYNNLILANSAHDSDPVKSGQGGGVDIQIGTDDFVLASNIIAGNRASSHGGGVCIFEYAPEEGDPVVTNNVIAFNHVLDTDYGAGLTTWTGTSGYVYNNLIQGNHGPGVWLQAETFFEYNLLWANTAAPAGPMGTLPGTNLQTASQVVGVSDNGVWTDDDWHPAGGSPLVDGGDPTVLDAAGGRSDIGAYGGPYGAW